MNGSVRNEPQEPQAVIRSLALCIEVGPGVRIGSVAVNVCELQISIYLHYYSLRVDSLIILSIL